MKRVLFGLIVGAFALTGCGNGSIIPSNNAKYEAIFKEAGETFYIHFQKSLGMTDNVITLDMIEQAMEKHPHVQFNIVGLEKCSKESTVTVIANSERDAVDYIFDIDC